MYCESAEMEAAVDGKDAFWIAAQHFCFSRGEMLQQRELVLHVPKFLFAD